MSTTPLYPPALAQSGFAALQQDDPRAARESFERLLAAGQANAATCLGLAFACHRLDDNAAAHAAVDRALALEPHNLQALILKADHLAAEGDTRGASSYYMTAVKSAPPADELPPDLRAELLRAQQMCAHVAGQLEGFLREHLARAGFAEQRSSARFAHSLDLLLGKKSVYFQQPRYYFFPELPQVQFYDRNGFAWLDALEAGAAAIRAELIEVLHDRSRFKPHVQGGPKRQHNEQRGMLDKPDRSAFYLWKDGELVAENAALCPATMRILGEIPLTRVKNRSPSVLFSLLRPGAHIPPRCGLVNTRLICHLPLIVPPGCTFRVGNDTRVPVEGRAWVFDDTLEHEEWNRSSQIRVILLFEIWRPELSEEERGLVSAMFEAVDTYTGEKPVWEI